MKNLKQINDRLQKIVDEREALLYTLNQYTGALEELAFLYKKGYVTKEIYRVRFDKIKAKFDALAIIFKNLLKESDDLRR